MRRPELSTDHIRLLEVAYAAFHETARWPTTAYVDAVLDHDFALNMEALLPTMPREIAHALNDYRTEHATVQLTVAGMSLVDAAQKDVERFISLIRFATHREREWRPLPHEPSRFSVTRDNAPSIWSEAITSSDIARLLVITQAESVYIASEGPSEDGNWTLWFDRTIRRYRSIESISDYIAHIPEREPFPPGPPPLLTPSIFILMPFEEAWSQNVKDEISQACQLSAKRFPGLKWQRADDITEPGRITAQIISAIDLSDLLIADITGSNPNVLFELGYADALHKSIIVLNQDIQDTPFDIVDWRQIPYSTDNLRRLRESLTRFIVDTLSRDRRLLSQAEYLKARQEERDGDLPPMDWEYGDDIALSE
jgi:hypothetical protein